MYIVEGNIGAGKSTFLKLIETHIPHISVIFEPLHNWQSQVYGQSILSNFYQEPKRWAYTMETLAMACRVQEHLKEQQNTYPFRVMERSIYSGHYVFATNDFQNGFLSELEWNIYLEWFKFLVTGHCNPPHGFIYLKVEPEIAYERIQKRNRSSEKGISRDYIQQIHDCHEAFLVNKNNVLPELSNVPVLVLDCNKEFEANPAQFAIHAQKVQEFMNASKITKPDSLTSFNVLQP